MAGRLEATMIYFGSATNFILDVYAITMSAVLVWAVVKSVRAFVRISYAFESASEALRATSRAVKPFEQFK
jgi:hypothetical protein